MSELVLGVTSLIYLNCSRCGQRSIGQMDPLANAMIKMCSEMGLWKEFWPNSDPRYAHYSAHRFQRTIASLVCLMYMMEFRRSLEGGGVTWPPRSCGSYVFLGVE